MSKGTTQSFYKDRVPTPKFQGDVAKGHGTIPPRCPKYGKNDVGNRLRGISVCYGCGRMENKIFECLNIDSKCREVRPQGQLAQRGQVQQSAQDQGAGPCGN